MAELFVAFLQQNRSKLLPMNSRFCLAGSFTAVCTRLTGAVVPVSTEQAREFESRRFGTHECFPHQKGMHVPLTHQGNVRRSSDTAFSDRNAIRRNPVQQLQSGFETGLERTKTPVVDSDQG